MTYPCDVIEFHPEIVDKAELVGPEDQHTFETAKIPRKFELIYDFQYPGPLYIQIGDHKPCSINQDFILPIDTFFMAYTPTPRLLTLDEKGNYIDADGVKFKCILLPLDFFGSCRGCFYRFKDYLFQSSGGILEYEKLPTPKIE